MILHVCHEILKRYGGLFKNVLRVSLKPPDIFIKTTLGFYQNLRWFLMKDKDVCNSLTVRLRPTAFCFPQKGAGTGKIRPDFLHAQPVSQDEFRLIADIPPRPDFAKKGTAACGQLLSADRYPETFKQNVPSKSG
jgi:hypothetical protein